MEDEEIQYDVRVYDAHVSYGKTKVINGSHMNVRSGTM